MLAKSAALLSRGLINSTLSGLSGLEPLRWGGECWAAATAIRKRGMSRTKPHRRSSVDFTIIFLIYISATRVFFRRCHKVEPTIEWLLRLSPQLIGSVRFDHYLDGRVARPLNGLLHEPFLVWLRTARALHIDRPTKSPSSCRR